MKTILVTGCAGFIGAAVCQVLISQGHSVVGVDNLNAYYDVGLKQARLAGLQGRPNFHFQRFDLADAAALQAVFQTHTIDAVVHLAAQAGVRYSLQNPAAYASANLVAFTHLLEMCRQYAVSHLVYASSSSVYGLNATTPFRETDGSDHPVSFYGATKRANELMAHSYSHNFGLPTTGLRFFTVYGPWGRPDMTPVSFSLAILRGTPIKVFNQGRMARDFTYIDDIVEGVVRTLHKPPDPNAEFDRHQPQPDRSSAPYRIFNIGNHQPVALMTYIELLEKKLGRTAEKIFVPMQAGDVESTCADTSALHEAVGFAPHTKLEDGLEHLTQWVRSYYAL
jgi:UDP-glucuronate 4-epimerase